MLYYPEHIEFLKKFIETHDIRIIGEDKYDLIKELETYDLLESRYNGWFLTYKARKYLSGEYKELHKFKRV